MQAMQVMQVVGAVISNPPIPFNPEQQTLKNWAMYCLRDRGFKVVYAQNADFAIEQRNGDKFYFKVTENKVTENPEQADNQVAWIVRDPATNQISLIASETTA